MDYHIKDFFINTIEQLQKISTYSLSSIKSKEEGRKASDVGLLINSMIEDHNHKIWIGTENAGLLAIMSREIILIMILSKKKTLAVFNTIII